MRLHRSDIVGDILGGAASLYAALELIREAGAGVVVYLRDGAAGVPLKQEQGTEQACQKHWLDVGLGAPSCATSAAPASGPSRRASSTTSACAGSGSRSNSNEPLG